ncbi:MULTISPECIES: APC family permease [Klebsiella]|uniref:APC family permease n=2 Tax=Klebsiella michiganensis TaxID=1134687 RepID=A0A6P1UWM6_9ENTR|nr:MULTISPECIES: APC family permease [Klebsiella]MEB8292178.1 APC family permease [Klebsiella michiganensis]QHS47321.1 APC family permease [Klebsiella michiganensis]QPQ10551.1 APC family permease [Klebsiella michiganensis]TYG02185.1 amino acid permease [Klebsiella grimontii]UPI86746.1 APC family permease [Klebsiella michiganensis]
MSVEQFGYKQELHRALTFRDLLVYGMIFMVPIAPFGVFGYVWDGAQGMVALAYLIGMVAMFFTAMSYWSMSRAFPVSGSVYAYAQRGIHPIVGFFAGWLILLDYILVPSLLYIVSAAALAPMLPGVPGWLWIVGFIAINSLINLRGITFTARANNTILIAEIVVLSVFVVLGLIALYSGAGAGHLTLDPLYNADKFSLPLVMGAVSIAVLSFLGFDGISTLSEETKGGVDTVGKASLGALMLVGSLFILQTWIAADLAQGMTFSSLDTAFYDTANLAGGGWLKYVTMWSTVISWGIANALVAQAAVSRILFAMARDKQLPQLLAKVHPRLKTPYVSTLFVALISLASGLWFYGDIDNLSRLVNFGALMGFLVLHIAVINHYIIRQKSRNLVVHLLFPVVGLCIIGFVIYEMDVQAKVLGLSWLAVGVVYYLLMRLVLKRNVELKLEG